MPKGQYKLSDAKSIGQFTPADMDPSGQSNGLLVPGNIDPNRRPEIDNPKGGKSTVYSASFNIDGREVLLPLADEGRIMTDAEAIAKYRRTGKHLGIFDSPEHATAYAQQLHNDYAAGKFQSANEPRIGAALPGTALPDWTGDAPYIAPGVRFGAAGTPMMPSSVTSAIGSALSSAGSVTSKAAAVAKVAAPVIKGEVARHGLKMIGVPWYIADPVADAIMVRSGRTKVPGNVIAAESAAPAEAASASHLDLSVPVRPGQLTRQQLNERMAVPNRPPTSRAGTAPVAPVPQPVAAPAPSVSTPAPSGSPMPVVEPVAVRPSGPKSAAPPPEGQIRMEAQALGKLKPTAEEYQSYQALRREGYAPADIITAIRRNRLPEAWRDLPNDADVGRVVAAKNARTTRAKGGTKP